MKPSTTLCAAAMLCLLGVDLTFGQITAGSDSREVKQGKKRGQYHHDVPFSHKQTALKGNSRELPFEVFRMLSVGMTKSEVISLAGPPRYTFHKSRSSAWMYSGTDRWVLEVIFGGDRVASLNWTRP